MKRKIIFLMTAVICCMACSWEDDIDLTEKETAYRQVSYVYSDSTETKEKQDSSFVATAAQRNVTVEDPDSQRCDLQIKGKLIVHGSCTDISSTYVTVEKIIVRVCTDNTDSTIICPAINKEVAEPENADSWEMLPVGVKYSRILLNTEPVTVVYKDSFMTEITICYLLRVRDTEKIGEADHYQNTVRYSSDSKGIWRENITVPLELTTIDFNAAVAANVQKGNP